MESNTPTIDTDTDDLEFEPNNLPFLTKDSFAATIEKIVLDEDLDYFNAIIAYCEDNNKEYDDVIKLMNPTLLEKVKQSARDAGLIDRLPSIIGL
jgi:hypothetical protein